jgi:two-component system, NtrC family, sensor kinase
MKPARLVVVSVLAATLLTLLFLAAQVRHTEPYTRTQNLVHLLGKQFDQLSEDILKSHTGLLENYDPLVRDLASCRSVARELARDHYGAGSRAIEAEIARLAAFIRSDEAWVAEYQSLHAVMHNSLAYISAPDGLAASFTDPRLRAIGDKLARKVLAFDEDATLDRAAEVEDELRRLDAERDAHPHAPDIPAIDHLLEHTRLVLGYRARVDRAVAELTGTGDERILAALDAKLEAELGRQLAATVRYRVLLYVVSILLLVLLARSFVQLQRTAGSLGQEKQLAEYARADLAASMTELRAAQDQLIEASRKSGMAEIATAVLHNVGNVLNSINVSAQVLTDAVRKSRAHGLTKVAELLHAHAADRARFLTQDERGKRLPEYLCSLAAAVEKEQEQVVGELMQVKRNVEHVKTIVSRQQSHAKGKSVVETFACHEVVDDAIQVAITPQVADRIQVVREYQTLAPVTSDRHKLMQIFVNLLGNAKHAVNNHTGGDKRIVARIGEGRDDRMFVEIEDNGYGIAPENLARVFSHGFSTKSDGHGFGLHGSMAAARELGGTLSVHSEGPGKGARFRLELPRAASAAA